VTAVRGTGRASVDILPSGKDKDYLIADLSLVGQLRKDFQTEPQSLYDVLFKR
jgi:hypothetical protein